MFILLRTPKSLKIFLNIKCPYSTVLQEANNEIKKQASKSKIDYKQIKYPTKVPQSPHISKTTYNSIRTPIDEETIKLLERLSLVNLDNK